VARRCTDLYTGGRYMLIHTHTHTHTHTDIYACRPVSAEGSKRRCTLRTSARCTSTAVNFTVMSVEDGHGHERSHALPPLWNLNRKCNDGRDRHLCGWVSGRWWWWWW
jgi:hypothetical protein